MAYGTVIGALNSSGVATLNGRVVTPVSTCNPWVDIITSASGTSGLTIADNSGLSVSNPLALIATAAASKAVILNNGLATSVQIRMAYDGTTAPSTTLVIQPFGLDASYKSYTAPGLPERLKDVNGTHELSLPTASTDPYDINGTSGYRFTDAVEVDMNGAVALLVAVKTAITSDSGTNKAKLQVRFK